MVTESQLARWGLFDARVPRYTSYPTAPHFSADFGADTAGNWIAGLTPGTGISLYVHVPFCRRLCWFCACRTQGTQSQAPLAAYLETLKAELALLRARLPKGVFLSRLHWGGGTPTLLSAEMITDLAAAIFDTLPLGERAEFSIEIDPNEIDAARLDALIGAGLNRVSIGIQDFDPEIQTIIGREQSYEVTRDAVDMIRARGVNSLNADILFGLPKQTNAGIAESIQKLLSLSPDRVALYGYAHVPWMAKRQQMIPADTLPDPQARLKLFETARQLLVWDQYREIGIDHFARPGDGLEIAARTGHLRRNFQGYTDDVAPTLIGLGASAISRFPQGYAQNHATTSQYTKAIRDGRLAVSRGHVFRGEDRLRARMIEMLMCEFAIDVVQLTQEFTLSEDAVRRILRPLGERYGDVLCISRDRLSIHPEARALTRILARELDAYDLSRAGHSSAI